MACISAQLARRRRHSISRIPSLRTWLSVGNDSKYVKFLYWMVPLIPMSARLHLRGVSAGALGSRAGGDGSAGGACAVTAVSGAAAAAAPATSRSVDVLAAGGGVT